MAGADPEAGRHENENGPNLVALDARSHLLKSRFPRGGGALTASLRHSRHCSSLAIIC
jgi:hypothetical protein